MRILLAALVLGVACAPLYAQTEKEPRKAETKKSSSQGHKVGRDSQPPKGQPSPAARQQMKQQSGGTRPQDQRARERAPGDPPPKRGAHTVSKDSQPPKGPPSKAQQMQQQQYEQRQAQQGQLAPDPGQVVQCRARPVCGGGYGICQGVTQTFTGAGVNASRHAIVQQCVQANTPDSCNCAAQCERVAQCSIF